MQFFFQLKSKRSHMTHNKDTGILEKPSQILYLLNKVLLFSINHWENYITNNIFSNQNA